MKRTDGGRPILALALLIGVLAGCGERRPAPTPPVQEMGTGLFVAGWYDSAPCDSDSACVTQITTSYSTSPRFPDPPMLWVRVDTLELVKISEISQAEAESTFYLTEAALRTVSKEHGGCSSELPSEFFNVFSGDYGHGADIQGCDTPEILAARAMFFGLLDRYGRRGHPGVGKQRHAAVE